MILTSADAPAVALVRAIRSGDVAALRAQLDATPGLAAARLVDERGVARTLLHVVADWPGHVPRGAELVAVLVQAGAAVNAPIWWTTEPTRTRWATTGRRRSRRRPPPVMTPW